MNESEFISNKLKELSSKFSGIMVYNEFKIESQTHFIKILPEEVFNSRELKLWTTDLISSYIDRFENSISFISENSLVRLDNPTVLYGFGSLPENKASSLKSTYPKTSSGLTSDINMSKKQYNEHYNMAA